MGWLKRKEPFVEAYLNSFTNEKIVDNYVALDTEFTSLDLNKAKLLSIGVIYIEKSKILLNTANEWFLKNPELSFDTAPIHQIISSSEFGLEEKVVLEKLLKYIGNRTIVAHSAGIDIRILNRYLSKYCNTKLKNKVLDTQKMAIFREHGAYPRAIKPLDFTLDALCKKHGVQVTRRHSSLGDAYATAQLFLEFYYGS